MLNADDSAFYNDYLAEHPNHLFGLTTTKVDSDGSWKWIKNRLGSAEDVREWLAAAVSHSYDCHLSLSVIPDEYRSETDSSYNMKEVKSLVTRAFVFDLDVHHNPEKKRKATDYASAAELRQSLDDAYAAGLPKPDYEVSSGSGGMHLWYFVQNYIAHTGHKAVQNAFCQAAAGFGLKVDPQAGYAKKKIRAPGSRNNKPHIVANVATKKITGQIRTLRSLQSEFGTRVNVRAAVAGALEASHREANEMPEYGTYTSEAVRNSCAYMIHQLTTGSKDLMDREQWLGVASIVRHLANWPEAWGKACIEHYGDVTQKDIDSALDPESGLRGPIRCEAIGGGVGNHPFCAGCKINTMGRGAGYPINFIQKVSANMAANQPVPVRDPVVVEEVDGEVDGELSSNPYSDKPVGDFMFHPAGTTWCVFSTKIIRQKTVPDTLVAKPAYDIRRVEIRSSGALVVLDVLGAEKYIEMQNINHGPSLSRALGKVGITVSQATHNLKYVQDLMVSSDIPTITMTPSAGWATDLQSFATLTHIIRPKGEPSIYQLENPPLNGAGIGEAGSLEGWMEAMDLLKEQQSPLMVFSLMLGFAAPLSRLVSGDPPAVVSYYHPDSGKGKSTALRLANSVFMQPVETNIGFDDTDASAFQSFGALSNIFCAIDDITAKVTDHNFRANRFVTSCLQGFERGRLTSGSQQMERHNWRTIIGISTNASICEPLAAEAAQGGLARVHEIFLDRIPMPKYQATEIVRILGDNHGIAGPEFIQRLIRTPNYRAMVQKRYSGWLASLEGAGYTDNSHRFALSLFALVMTAAQFAQEYRLHTFSTKALFNFCVEELGKRVRNDKLQVQRIDISPADYFNFIRLDIHTVEGARMFETESAHARDSIHPVFYEKGKVYFSRMALDHYRKTQRLGADILTKWVNKGTVSGNNVTRQFRMAGQPIASTLYHVMDVTEFTDVRELNLRAEALSDGTR